MKGKNSMSVVLSLASTAISVIIGGSVLLGNIKNSDNSDVSLSYKVKNLEEDNAETKSEIKSLSQQLVSLEKNVVKINTNVEYLVGHAKRNNTPI